MSKKIESENTFINRPAEELFNFLGNFGNFSHLMPEQVVNWQATTDDCSFEIKGLATLGMRIIERMPVSRIVMKGEGKLPFDFTLCCNLNALTVSATEIRLVIDADMSPFIGMMATAPLQNFVNMLVIRLKEVMENPSQV